MYGTALQTTLLVLNDPGSIWSIVGCSELVMTQVAYVYGIIVLVMTRVSYSILMNTGYNAMLWYHSIYALW